MPERGDRRSGNSQCSNGLRKAQIVEPFANARDCDGRSYEQRLHFFAVAREAIERALQSSRIERGDLLFFKRRDARLEPALFSKHPQRAVTGHRQRGDGADTDEDHAAESEDFLLSVELLVLELLVLELLAELSLDEPSLLDELSLLLDVRESVA